VLGIPFLESGDAIPIVLDTNRADVISIKVADYDQSMDSTNVTIIVQALRQGTALARVIYKSDPQIVDWIMIKVGAYVSPQSATVHIGGHVTFSIIGKGLHGLPTGERGSWLSGNESIVHVNIHTGEAVAIGEGTTTGKEFLGAISFCCIDSSGLDSSSYSILNVDQQLLNLSIQGTGLHFMQ
jgi:nuclear pore complex protein Nup210